MEERAGRFAYSKQSLAAVHSLTSLAGIVRRELSKIKAPVLVIQSRQDQGLLPESGEEIIRLVQAERKRLVWFEHSGHLITIDRERERVLSVAGEFISEVEQKYHSKGGR
ncbi:MAG: alpha/beta hydrolase [Bacillota bacterium]